MDVALAVFALAPGLALGSFLNVVAARLPERRSLVRRRSSCRSCGHEIAWYDNVPLVSYAVLRGRCRACDARIGLLYPAVELATALLLAGSILAFGPSLRAAAAVVFCCAWARSASSFSRRRARSGRSRPLLPLPSCSSPRSYTRRGWAWAT